jgi:hypothetical protein
LTRLKSDGAESDPSSTNHYMSVGIFLMIFGAITAAASLLLGVIPILALGFASFLIGIMTLYLPEPAGNLADRLASDSSIPALLNIENLLEDLSLNEKGVYIPTSGLGACPKVFVPLTATGRRPSRDLNNTRRVFITLDEKAREGGLLLEAPGRNLLSELERELKLDLSKVNVQELAEKLGMALKSLEISKSVEFQKGDDRAVTFQIELNALRNLEVSLSSLTPRLFEQIGTPVSSAIAAAFSKSTGQYVTLRQVSINLAENKIIATLQFAK